MPAPDWETCPACGHAVGQHFQAVDGKVRCLAAEHGTTSSGIIGLPYTVVCDCLDYHSARRAAQLAEAQAEQARWEKEMAPLLAEVKARLALDLKPDSNAAH